MKELNAFMNDLFKPNEKLYRAVYPPEVVAMFWRKDGTISSAAFADAKGLSVDRGNHRPDSSVIEAMRKKFTGHIIYLYVKNCLDIGASVLHCECFLIAYCQAPPQCGQALWIPQTYCPPQRSQLSCAYI